MVELSYQITLSEWIGSKTWTHFTTITSAYPLSLTSAKRLAERTLSRWKTITHSEADMVYAIERNTDGGSHHVHALVDFKAEVPDHLFPDMIDTKGNIHLRAYDHTLRGAEYVVKSVNEHRDNWDFIS